MIGFLLIFVLCMIGILILLYWIPRKMGYPRLAKYLSLGLSLLLVLIISFGIFQDAFFTKNQAKKLLAEQDIVLKDDFKILNNKKGSPLSDYYHRFRIEISEKDRNSIEERIKNAVGFINLGQEKIDIRSNYGASKFVQNYEDSTMYVREFYRPNHEGGKSTYKKIELNKGGKTLVFIEMRD